MSIRCVGTSRVSVVAAALVLSSGLSAGVASAQSLEGLGFLASGTESYARSVSDTGVVAGYGFIPPANSPTTGFRAFSWTDVGDMVNLGTLPGETSSAGRAVSADGSVIVGWSGGNYAFRHDGAMSELEGLPGLVGALANSVSDDGSAIIGYAGNPNYGRAVRWINGSVTDLGVPSGGGWILSYAYGVSGDGSVVVGYAEKANTTRAFRWENGSMKALGVLKGGGYAEAWAADDDGSVVVGTSDSKKGPRAVRWVGNSVTDLGTIPGQPYSYGRSVSGDGSMIVGYCSDGSTETHPTSGSILSTGHAFLWTSSTGMIDLNDYLPTLGIDLTDWELREARGISADGTTIVGWGWHYDSLTDTSSPEAWIARLVP